MGRLNKYILFYLFAGAFLNLTAQPELKFVRYTINEGLAHNYVLCIHQDKYGFMWFGTKNGCSRYDGMEFKNYQYENIPASIGRGVINNIISDNKNGLWFTIAGEGNTLIRYDYENDKFIDLSASIRKKLNYGNETFSFWYVYPDSEGHIWFSATNCGFMYYDLETQEIKSFNNYNNIPKGYPIVRDIMEDSDHNIWFASLNGLFVYSKKDDSFTCYKHDPKDITSISSDNCNCVFMDSDKEIWVGTREGLNKLIRSPSGSISFKKITNTPKHSYNLSQSLVYDIVEDKNGNLLIATVNGLYLMKKESGEIFSYYEDELDRESINSNIVRSVYLDNDDNIWVGTSSGIGKAQIKNFKAFSHSSYKNSVSHNKVEYIYQAPTSDIWIATPEGIDIFDKKNKQFRHILNVTRDKKGLYEAPIMLYPDQNKGMWIGTYGGGLNHFNYSTKEVMVHHLATDKVQPLNNVFSIFIDSKNNFWYSGSGNGIYTYNFKTKAGKIFSDDDKHENSLSSNTVQYIMEDSDSNIWVGTMNGLDLLTDYKKGTFKHYLNGISVNYIYESSNKTLWLATSYAGLYQLNKSTRQFKKYNSGNGLPGNTIWGILEDKNQNLWISTDKGLAKFKPLKDSIAEVIVYRKEEGVAVGDFLARSCAKLSDGTMVFGGTVGFLMFQPSDIKNDTIPPSLVFTGLKVGNKNVNIGEEINKQVILNKSIIRTQQLVFNYKNKTFTIEFTGIQYNMPEYNQYCYRLEGYDFPQTEWHYTDAHSRKVEYMNLPKGNYVFKVKAANSHGVWNNEPKELKIKILPPWWKTTWFTILWTLSLSLLVFLIIKIRTYRLQQQKTKLKKIVERRTIELREQMEQMAKMNKEIENMAMQVHEADQSKLHFFANISHEFRTPLSLIIGPLEKYLNLAQSEEWVKVKSSYIHLMHKNAKRLLKLINEIIDFRKMDQGEKKLSISNNNIEEFVNEIVDVFAAQAEQKNIKLTVTNLKEEYKHYATNFWFDPNIMEKILYNLISNAIKYTPEQGEVSIQLSVNSNQSTTNNDQLTVNSNQFLIIRVSDTGIGIKKENVNKIFNRFYREETNESNTIEGTGIGLAYTKELIGLHRGNISVESESGEGTTFTLQFPLGKESFRESAITKNISSVNFEYTRSMIEDSAQENFPELIEYEETGLEEIQEEEPKVERETVLLIEDNNDLRKFIKEELETKYRILEAENGKKGWEMAFENDPHLIVSDVMMPVMDGIELCEKIKTNENTSHIPIILLTAKTGDENTIKGLETGANDYITKPFDINILKIKINNLFLLRKSMQEKFSDSINVKPSEITHSLLDQQFIQKAIEVVNENMSNYDFDNESFVNQMGYSRSVIYKKMKNLTNQSVSEFIRSIRLKTAAKLFLEGNPNVAEVCYRVGFKHHSSFTYQFNKMFGKSPTIFIKEKLPDN